MTLKITHWKTRVTMKIEIKGENKGLWVSFSVEREISQFTSHGSATQWAATTWSWFHMAWVAVSQQTEIRSRKVQGRSAEMGLPSRRTGHYLWMWNCSADYGTPASLSTDEATLTHEDLAEFNDSARHSCIGSGASDPLLGHFEKKKSKQEIFQWDYKWLTSLNNNSRQISVW